MLRHLKNLNELVLYASFSCGAAYVGRLVPAFYFPILLLRLSIFLYCLYVIASLEKNKELAIILGGALLVGMIGGYWDYIELLIKFDFPKISAFVSGFLLFVAATAIVIHQLQANGQASKK
jgi:hypothetical protein